VATWFVVLASANLVNVADLGLRNAGHADLVASVQAGDQAATQAFRQIWLLTRGMIVLMSVLFVAYESWADARVFWLSLTLTAALCGPVFVLDPRGLDHRFDPLAGRTSEDQLLSSAHHLLFHDREGEGRIFTERAIVMLTQLFLAARLEGQVPLPYVRHMIRQGLVATALRLETLDPTLTVQFLDVAFAEANFSDRFLLSAWGRSQPVCGYF
jgi:hypothetical protein